MSSNLEIKAPGVALAAAVLELVRRFCRAERTLLTAGEDLDMASLRERLAASDVAPAIGASRADILAVVQSALESRAPATDSMAIQIPDEFAGEELLTVDLFELIKSFRTLLSRLDEEEKLKLKKDRVSVAEKIAWLSDVIDERGSVAFIPLLEELPTLGAASCARRRGRCSVSWVAKSTVSMKTNSCSSGEAAGPIRIRLLGLSPVVSLMVRTRSPAPTATPWAPTTTWPSDLRWSS